MTLFEKTEKSDLTCPTCDGEMSKVSQPINVVFLRCDKCGEFSEDFVTGYRQADKRTQAIISMLDEALYDCNMNGEGLTVAGKIDALRLEFKHKLNALIWIMKNDPTVTGGDAFYYAERCASKARKEVDANRPTWDGMGGTNYFFFPAFNLSVLAFAFSIPFFSPSIKAR